MVAGSFSIILPKIDPDKVDQAKTELAELFAIMKTTARKIVESAPVVLLDNASQEEVDMVKARFNGTSGIGLQLDIRSDAAPGIPKIKWKTRPQIASAPSLDSTTSLPADAPSTTAADSPAPSTNTPKAEGAQTKDMSEEYAAALGEEDDIYTYSVFLSNIGSVVRREKAIEELMIIRNISHQEADELCNRTVIPVIKGISKTEAERTLKTFIKHKIFGCITKRPKAQ